MEESDDVLSMLHTLMDITEAGTGTMRLDLQDLAVSDVVASVADLYELVAEEQGVVLETDVPAGLSVQADPARLRQLLANLVDNAIKYSDAGDQVRVTAEADGAQVALRVADTGRGIDPEDLPRIWDRLYRGDRSRHERGLGLGLSFVRAIAERTGARPTSRARSEGDRSSPCDCRVPRARDGLKGRRERRLPPPRSASIDGDRVEDPLNEVFARRILALVRVPGSALHAVAQHGRGDGPDVRVLDVASSREERVRLGGGDESQRGAGRRLEAQVVGSGQAVQRRDAASRARGGRRSP